MKKHFVVAVYNDVEKAKATVHRLLEAGVKKRSISVVGKSNEEEIEEVELEKTNSDVLVWGAQGALWGGLLGLLLGGVLFVVPGFGPIVGVGPVAAALAGMLGGAMTGAAALGLADALIEWGMGEIEAKRFEKLVEENKVLVVVHGDEADVQHAETVLKESGAESVEVH